jgi:hypothetical protein
MVSAEIADGSRGVELRRYIQGREVCVVGAERCCQRARTASECGPDFHDPWWSDDPRQRLRPSLRPARRSARPEAASMPRPWASCSRRTWAEPNGAGAALLYAIPPAAATAAVANGPPVPIRYQSAMDLTDETGTCCYQDRPEPRPGLDRALVRITLVDRRLVVNVHPAVDRAACPEGSGNGGLR